MMRGRKVFAWMTALVLCALNGPATAQKKGEKKVAAADQEETPWGKGVSPEKRANAQRLLEEGNQLFLTGKHRDALERYLRATESWDHPAIRFNIVRALIQLDRAVEAYENLEQALRYGSAPLGNDLYLEAQNYRRLLRGQIAEIEISCSQEGARVAVDGRRALSCPGKKAMRVLPGPHQVLARLSGYLTFAREVLAMPGKSESVDVTLISIEDAKTERRWAWWKPWAVVGGGAALGLTGLLLQGKAAGDYDRYGDALEESCGEDGCLPEDIPKSDRDLADRARLENRLAVGFMIGGATAIAAGATLVFLNRKRPVLPDSAPPEGDRRSFAVVPTAGSDGAGVSLQGRF